MRANTDWFRDAGWGVFGLESPLGVAYAFVRDIFTMLVIVGVVLLICMLGACGSCGGCASMGGTSSGRLSFMM